MLSQPPALLVVPVLTLSKLATPTETQKCQIMTLVKLVLYLEGRWFESRSYNVEIAFFFFSNVCFNEISYFFYLLELLKLNFTLKLQKLTPPKLSSLL